MPADTIFVKALAGQFDAVVAMYHDQGHIAVKTLGFAMDPKTADERALRASTSRSACRSCAPRSTTARRSTSRARASPTPQSMLEAIEFAARLVGARARTANQPTRPATGGQSWASPRSRCAAWYSAIFAHAGTDAAEAGAIADHLIEANLVGHDSHGVIRVAPYIELLSRAACGANRACRIMHRRRRR